VPVWRESSEAGPASVDYFFGGDEVAVRGFDKVLGPETIEPGRACRDPRPDMDGPRARHQAHIASTSEARWGPVHADWLGIGGG
jgi:hypothetical protein